MKNTQKGYRNKGEKMSDDALARRLRAIEEENLRLKQKLQEKEDNENLVEVLNVVKGTVVLRDFQNNPITFTGYGTQKCRHVVPERLWIHWMRQGALAIGLGQIRVERFVFPDGLEVPEEYRGNTYTDEEIIELFNMSPKRFSKLIKEINEPEIWKRFYDTGVEYYQKALKKKREVNPNLYANLVNLEFLPEVLKEIHNIEDGATEVITFTGEKRIRQALRTNTFDREAPL